MREYIIEFAIAIIGSGAIGSLVMYIYSNFKKQILIEQHTTAICDLETRFKDVDEQIDYLKDNLNSVKTNTNERLVKIETQITGLQTQLVDIAKDIKTMLMAGKFTDA